MRKTMRRSGLVMSAAIFALAICGLSNIAFGQTTTGVTVTTQGPRGVEGKPYMADEFLERTQTLQDGNRIIHKSLTKVCRDSEGRTRREQYRINLQGAPDETPMSVDIFDPVAGVAYMLDPRTRTAHRRALRVAPPPPSANTAGPTSQQPNAPAGPAAIRPETRKEPLGSQEIEGFITEGKRITTVIPAGADGNEQPLEIVTELWFSPDLGIDLLMKRDDPRLGQTVTQLTHIRLEEPSPELFQVPPDYSVQEIPPPVPPAPAQPADNK